MTENMKYLDHEKLNVYKTSLELIVLVDQINENLPKGRGYITDQFQRASLSISLNIAEGAGEFSSTEKGRFYRIAKRSATECAGIFDVCFNLKLIEEELYSKGRELLHQIVAMLTRLAQIHGK